MRKVSAERGQGGGGTPVARRGNGGIPPLGTAGPAGTAGMPKLE
jgi:hypothetical protein